MNTLAFIPFWQYVLAVIWIVPTLSVSHCIQPINFSNEMTLSNSKTKTITEQGMTVSWQFSDDCIHFTLEAPTLGWVAIGFNESPDLSDTYLIMGRVNDQAVSVWEHYVYRPGDYTPFSVIGEDTQIFEANGEEKNGKTRIRFKLPLSSSSSRYRKPIAPGSQYHLLMAYSREDDFQHHSMMRTTVHITL